MRYSTLFEFKHSTNSRKSSLRGIGERSFLDREKYVDPLLGSHLTSRKGIRRVGFLESLENANGFIHIHDFSAGRPALLGSAFQHFFAGPAITLSKTGGPSDTLFHKLAGIRFVIALRTMADGGVE